MTEIEQLILEVQSKGAADVNKRLDEMDKKAKGVTKSFDLTKYAIAGLAASAAGLGLLAHKLVEATKSYQDMNAQLKIATKSQEGATKATEAINDLAATTPYDVAQVTNAFIKLVNLGLDPSEAAIKSYGNTASSMGKELTDFIEAVADAATGEFERLKEFGIKASKEGDKITFMFQGQQTVVQNTSRAIEGYLQTLGNKQFAGAMEERMKTLTGAISNLGDAWDQLWINLAKTGADAILVKGFQLAGDALQELNDRLKSGQWENDLQAYKMLWSGAMGDIQTSITKTSSVFDDAADYWASKLDVEKEDLVKFFKYFPIEARAGVQGMTFEFIKWRDNLGVIFKATGEAIKNEFDSWVEAAKVTGSAMGRAIKLDFSGNWEGDMEKVGKKQEAGVQRIKKTVEEGLKLNDNFFEENMAGVGNELKAQEDAIEAEREKGKVKRKNFEDERAARAEQGGDRLSGFAVPEGPKGPTDAEKKKAEETKKFEEKLMEDRLKSVEDGITREGQVIASGYEERKKRILENEATTQAEKKALVLAALSESLVSEEQGIKDSYDRRKEFIMSSTALTEAQKTALMTNLTKAREEQVRKIEQDNMNKRLDQASSFFGNIASIGSTFGKKGFKIAQAAAIAQATIDTYKAATGAYASLAAIPYVGPALGIAAAAAAVVAGAANIARIKSQTYQGAMEHGGMISAGKYALVGEAGPEFVKGPAVVTSAATTAANARSNRTATGVQTVHVANWGAPVQAEATQNGDQLLITLRPLLEKNKADTKREIASDISRGGGGVSQKLEQTYGLRRANAT